VQSFEKSAEGIELDGRVDFHPHPRRQSDSEHKCDSACFHVNDVPSAADLRAHCGMIALLLHAGAIYHYSMVVSFQHM
jgi:hypothetical protein